jgi:plastocyanin
MLAALVAVLAFLPDGAIARDPARIQVVEKEYSLVLSRLHVSPGVTIVQLINFGMDNHDLVIQGNAKGSKAFHFKQLSPKERQTITLKLPAGRYTMWCSLPGHRERGMVAPLVVR